MTTPAAGGFAGSANGRVDRIRHRLVWALLVPFCVLMGVSTVEGFSPLGSSRPALAVAVLIVAAIVVPVFMAWLARAILAEATTLEAERQKLADLYGRARHEALVDGLTGLGNHRAFQDELARQLEVAKRHGAPLSLLLVDVDDLKSVNDTMGHAGGDRLLEAVGQVASNVLRRSDRAFRVGGDEFAILLPDSDVETGLAVARRILASALNGGDPSDEVEPFSLSIGVSEEQPAADQHRRTELAVDAGVPIDGVGVFELDENDLTLRGSPFRAPDPERIGFGGGRPDVPSRQGHAPAGRGCRGPGTAVRERPGCEGHHHQRDPFLRADSQVTSMISYITFGK